MSTFNGFGYYTNVGTTLRQGAEVSAHWTGDRWSAYANYTYIDAIYLTTFQEPSPNNPLADANGNIPITNGTQIAGIPKNTVKVGVDYAVTPNWKVGADMVAASGQVIFGNENNAVPQVPGYAVLACTRPTKSTSKCRSMAWFRTFSISAIIPPAALFDREFMTRPVHDQSAALGPAKPVAIYGGIRITL